MLTLNQDGWMEFIWATFSMLSTPKISKTPTRLPGVSFLTANIRYSIKILTLLLDDIALQYTLIYKNTIQNAGSTNYSGLLYHGYDYSKTASWANSDRGHSPEIWDRALGWYFMAMVDILEIFPTTHKGYAQITQILQDLSPKLVKAADKTSGVWWLVMTQPGRAKNYFESSGTAMFVYSLLKGVRLGYIKDSDGSIIAAAKKAYSYIIANWVKEKSDGTFDWLNTVEVTHKLL
jgi:rhamnogalacturonyl hydrolase YesR